MTDFWRSGCGSLPTGTPEAAFLPDFTVIPNNTKAIAKITAFVNVNKDNQFTGLVDKYLNITWKIEEGDYKGQEVSQKIKCFDGKPEAIDRALNMLKLIMTLCKYTPTHGNAPTDDDLKNMVHKVMGIKIREWELEKKDGSGFLYGNNVVEVHHAHGFTCETGVKLVPKSSTTNYQTALSRNPRNSMSDLSEDHLSDDIPF